MIYFAHEKTDHTQSKPGYARHIYANPYQPEICPILSLGIFFLIVDMTNTDSEQIFTGTNQYSRFERILQSKFADEELLGRSNGIYGSHSIRKRAATFASSETTACPPFAAVSLSAGWAMGGVTSLYIQYQEAGDHYVGRTVCGLNPSDPSFAILPPRFKSYFDPIPLLRTIFSRYDDAIPELKQVLMFTTASVIHHKDWLISNHPRNHPLFLTTLFRERFERPLSEMVECRNWKPGDVMRATGIPPHAEILLVRSNYRRWWKEFLTLLVAS